MKEKEWDNPNKMRFNSGHKTFDKQCVLCSTGNIIAPTQWSGYIRAKTKLECNGITNEPDHLRKFDLAGGKWDNKLRGSVLREVLKWTETNDVILYQFQHYANCRAGREREVRKVIDGYVVTDVHHHYLWHGVMNHNYQAGSKILAECLKYITKPEEPYEDLDALP